jgi:predicted esterase
MGLGANQGSVFRPYVEHNGSSAKFFPPERNPANAGLSGRRTMTLIDGPRLLPKSGMAKQLVVFLHGYGADGNDLIGIGKQWAQFLPDAVFVSPHAPEPCGGAPMGRQWFGLTFRDPNERWAGVNKARPVLDAFLDAELARHGLAEGKMALVGFSQGTMMALHAGLRRKSLRGHCWLFRYSGRRRTSRGDDREASGAADPW